MISNNVSHNSLHFNHHNVLSLCTGVYREDFKPDLTVRDTFINFFKKIFLLEDKEKRLIKLYKRIHSNYLDDQLNALIELKNNTCPALKNNYKVTVIYGEDYVETNIKSIEVSYDGFLLKKIELPASVIELHENKIDDVRQNKFEEFIESGGFKIEEKFNGTYFFTALNLGLKKLLVDINDMRKIVKDYQKINNFSDDKDNNKICSYVQITMTTSIMKILTDIAKKIPCYFVTISKMFELDSDHSVLSAASKQAFIAQLKNNIISSQMLSDVIKGTSGLLYQDNIEKLGVELNMLSKKVCEITMLFYESHIEKSCATFCDQGSN
ncbi:hypothetical protein [Candidatus Regiella insecticola]|nr:hypothetical protein [Candidatus Regiella insecticola]